MLCRSSVFQIAPRWISCQTNITVRCQMFLIIYFSHRKKILEHIFVSSTTFENIIKNVVQRWCFFIFWAKLKCYAQIFCIFFSVHLVQFFPLYQTDKKLLSAQMFFNPCFSKNTKNPYQIFRTLPKSL